LKGQNATEKCVGFWKLTGERKNAAANRCGKENGFPAVSRRALLSHFRVNLSGILEAFIDEIIILSFFVFASDFDESPYDNQQQNQRGEQQCEPES